MRTIALSLAMGSLLLAVARIAVGNDFDVLLQDLSFGDPSPPVETLAANSPPAAESSEGVNGLLMPSPDADRARPARQQPSPQQALVADPGMIEQLVPKQSHRDVDFDAVFTSKEASDSDDALADIEPVPTPEPMPMDGEPIVAAPITDPAYIHDNAYVATGHGCGCGHGYGHHCGQVVTCLPHVAPNLPNSTFLQYFRSNKCYSNVWDGYHQKCGCGHAHIHGTCDCCDPHRRSCFSAGHSHCGNCDACDR